MRAAEYFHQVYNGYTNLLTPTVMQYWLTHTYAIELSRGSGIDHKPIFGVTVIDRETCTSNHELSQLCFSEKDARYYIQQLVNGEAN